MSNKIFLLFFLLPISLGATTYVEGSILEDTKWLRANSPYIITQNLLIAEGACLRIEAGVELQFVHETQILVKGGLSAIGSKRKPIRFLGHNNAPWNGLRFYHNCLHFEEGQVRSTQFEYCEFLGIGEAPAQLLRTEGCHLSIRNCKIEDCYTAIQSERQAKIQLIDSEIRNCDRALNVRNSSMAKVRGNEIENCNSIMLGGSTDFENNQLKKFTSYGRHSGLVIWMLGGGLINIRNNEFEQFEGVAIKLQKMSRRSSLNIRQNQFKGNETNLKLSCQYANKGKTLVEENNFIDCKRYQLALFSPCADEPAPIVIGPNYWGKSDENAFLDQEQDLNISAKLQVAAGPKKPYR